MESRITILIADDHPIFRQGLKEVIEREVDFKVIHEAHDGEMALRLMQQHHPDVAILDIDMPKVNGLDVARTVAKKNIPVGIIFLTMYNEEDMFNEAMDAGVRGYVLKENAASEVVDSIKTVAAGKYYISPSISDYLVSRSERAKALIKKKPSIADLTPSEKRILKLISENKTSKEIGEELFISSKTVENHRVNICNKLDIHGSHSLLKFAIEHKSHL